MPSVAQNADVLQTPIIFRIVEPVSDDELVWNLEPDIIHLNRTLPALRLVEQGRNAQRLRFPLGEELKQVAQRHAAIDDIFDDYDIVPFDGNVQILREPDFA